MKKLYREFATFRLAVAYTNTGFWNGRERMREALRKSGVPEDEIDAIDGKNKKK